MDPHYWAATVLARLGKGRLVYYVCLLLHIRSARNAKDLVTGLRLSVSRVLVVGQVHVRTLLWIKGVKLYVLRRRKLNV